MLALPFPGSDILRLADWLELDALLSTDKTSHRGDLERLLQREDIEGASRQHDIERLINDAFNELEDRAVAANAGYPFSLKGGLLSLKSKLEDYPAYVFCLCLSYFGWKHAKGEGLFPRRMFEDVSSIAAKNYIGGHSVRFASPRKDLPHGFRQAIGELCKQLGEGGGFSGKNILSSKDDALDIVAWKHFPDQRAGKLVLFGQCASGRGGKGKVTELTPGPFCEDWMRDAPASPLIRAYFIPHRLNANSWVYTTRRAGIVFDRCRLSFWAHQEKSLPGKRLYIGWARTVLDSLRERPKARPRR